MLHRGFWRVQQLAFVSFVHVRVGWDKTSLRMAAWQWCCHSLQARKYFRVTLGMMLCQLDYCSAWDPWVPLLWDATKYACMYSHCRRESWMDRTSNHRY